MGWSASGITRCVADRIIMMEAGKGGRHGLAAAH